MVKFAKVLRELLCEQGRELLQLVLEKLPMDMLGVTMLILVRFETTCRVSS